MNVSFQKRTSIVAIVAGAALLGFSGLREAAAQTAPSNPLRPARRAVVEPASVQQAVAIQPVRAAARTGEVRRAGVGAPQDEFQSVYKPVSYGKRVTRASRPAKRVASRSTPGFVPLHARTVYAQTQYSQTPTEVLERPVPEQSVLEPSYSSGDPNGIMMESLPGEGEFMGSGYGGAASDCDGCAECGGRGDCGNCGSCGGCGGCGGCLIPCPNWRFDNFEFFGGVQGFTAPLNRGETGSFGFHYGANWAVPVPCVPNRPIGMQLGYRGISSNYSGASFSEDSRNQGFFTAGLFRRVDWGLQGGLVVDVLTDDWYYDTLELTQLRGELSWVYPQHHELGFWFTTATKNNDVQSALVVNGQRSLLIETYEATDLLAFFYRRRFEEVGGGYGRLFAGFTGSSEGLIGADFKLPLMPSVALQTEFTYLVPKDGSNRVAHLQEAWNVGISLVWYPGRRKAVGKDYFRPLFDVADNGNFIVRPVTND